MKSMQAECVRYIKHGGVKAFAMSIFTFMFIIPTMLKLHSVAVETVIEMSLLLPLE